MVISNWLERLVDTVADHGRELLGLLHDAEQHDDRRLCNELIKGQGEATNIALAREILLRWHAKDTDEKLDFLLMLAAEFDPDPEAVLVAAKAYHPDDYETLARLTKVTEPPRQDLLRRLNMSKNGTAILVDMRSFLLEHLKSNPSLKKLDADFQHLLVSWFNCGFLQLKRIDWDSPASVLEKLMRFEAVHPMQGWNDLHRRLADDRRCFGFFHPALPGQPLIFVEVALTSEISHSVAPLIDYDEPVQDISKANSAIFYSINNALTGLRGVSFGNFLIKQVASELQQELPQIKHFVTLSPIPGFRRCLESCNDNTCLNLLGDDAVEIMEKAGVDSLSAALDKLLAQKADQDIQVLLSRALKKMALFYLADSKRGDKAYDPVAHFHLSNGAMLYRINTFANLNDYGIKQSWGCMVNYYYDHAHIVANHEAYVSDGVIVMSRELEKIHRQQKNSLQTKH